MTTNFNTTKSQFSLLLQQDQEVCQSLQDIENKLFEKCNDVEALDKRISEMSVHIKKTDSVAKNRSLGTRVGYGFEGIAIALVTPISWCLGLIVCLGGLANPRPYNEDDIFLFKAPVKLCGKLFAEASRSKEDYEKKLERLKFDKEALLKDRITAMSEIDELEEKRKNQLEKISKISLSGLQIDQATSQLIQNVHQLLTKAESLSARVKQLKAPEDEAKTEI